MPLINSSEKLIFSDNDSWTTVLEDFSKQKEKETNTDFYCYSHLPAYFSPNIRQFNGVEYSMEEVNRFTKLSLRDIVNETVRRKDLSLSQRIRLVEVLGKLVKMYNGFSDSYARCKAEWLIKQLKPSEQEIKIIANFQSIYRKNRIPNKWYRITRKVIDQRIDATIKIQRVYKKYRFRVKLHQSIDQKRKAAIKIQRCYRSYRLNKTANHGWMHSFWTMLKKIYDLVVMLFKN